MKGLRPPGVSHTFDLHHNEPKVRQRIAIHTGSLKSVGSKRAALRPRINEIDDWVLLREVEAGGTKKKSVDFGLTVMPLHMKSFGGDPPRRLQACDIAVCQLLDRPTGAIAQNHHLGLLRRGIDIYDKFSITGYGCHVIGV